MNPRLKKNLSDKETKELEGLLQHGLLARQLREVLKDELDEVLSSERSIKQFENPNWSHLQAFKNGRATTLQKILNLIGE